jgi:hypothetical protein
MFGAIYILVFAVLFAYLATKLSKSLIGLRRNWRLTRACLLSVLWPFGLPYMLLTGELMKSQMELDEEEYDKHLESQMDEVMKALADSGQIPKDIIKFRQKIKEKIGSFSKMLDDMIYYSYPVSQEELAGLIAYKYYKKHKVPSYAKDDGPIKFVLSNGNSLLDLTTSISKQMGDKKEISSRGMCRTSLFKEILGFHTLESGLTFLGAVTEGLHHEMYFIVYYDGEKLKVYVPKHNCLNRDTNRLLGEDEDKDYDYISSALGEVSRSNMYVEYKKTISLERISKEIEDQVNYAPRKGHPPKRGWEDVQFED